MPLTLKPVLEIIGSYSKPKGQATAAFDLGYRAPQATILTGVGAGQADIFYSARGQSIVGAVNVDIDLSGVAVDAIGDIVPFVKVKGAFLYAYAANPNAIRVGNAAAPFLGWFNGGTMTEDVPADGVLVHTHPGAGWTVTGVTADILRLANPAATTLFYDLMIWGTSA